MSACRAKRHGRQINIQYLLDEVDTSEHRGEFMEATIKDKSIFSFMFCEIPAQSGRFGGNKLPGPPYYFPWPNLWFPVLPMLFKLDSFQFVMLFLDPVFQLFPYVICPPTHTYIAYSYTNMTSFGGEFRMTLWPYLKMPKSENAKIGTGHTQIQHPTIQKNQKLCRIRILVWKRHPNTAFVSHA